MPYENESDSEETESTLFENDGNTSKSFEDTELYDLNNNINKASEETESYGLNENSDNIEQCDNEKTVSSEKSDFSEVEDEKLIEKNEDSTDVFAPENNDLYEKTRDDIDDNSEYTSEINNNINSVDELKVYQDAGLHEQSVDGKTCLVREDIDWEQTDEFGRTNRERVEDDNLVPYAENGEKIELHHIGQRDDSPFAELTTSEHRGKNYDAILHDKSKKSEINRSEYNYVRIEYWKNRIS